MSLPDLRIVDHVAALAHWEPFSWAPDGRRLAVARSGTVNVMRLENRTLKRVVEFPEVEAVEWSPSGDTIAFAATPKTRVSSSGVGAPCSPWRKPSQIYSVISSGTGLRQLTSTGNNVRPAWSPDGERIAYLSALSDEQILLMTMRNDGSDKQVVRSIDAPCWTLGMGLAWSPDGQRFAVVSRGGIVTMNVDGSDVRFVHRGQGRLSWQSRR